ncbi:hypothetical protein LOK49_LG11G00193 [Camellia lanceoleosa]|uniref:Uncharacterized protein n=1 Tax=Camellia lanceoleosa TaxID=1840588 RepID=A0ACC0G1M2_9ERIC|nr:hypothetical protein LOK49_LG11G00193 [Camellia lanceoleosa]
MARYYRNLQIKSISAKGLERVNLSGNKMEAYAYVLISGSGKQRTVVDRVGDTNPTWNGTMNFMVEEESAEDQILMFELCCCEPNGGDKDIGEVFVNVKDLMGPIEGSLTYHVLRTPPGNPKGKLNFMYEWGDQVAGAVLTPPTPPTPPPPPAFTAYNPPPPPYAAAAAATGQYLPYPPPAPVMLMGPLPPGSYGYPLPPQPGYGYWYGYGYGPQTERANNSGSIGGWLGRVIAGAAITEILNNISLP